MEDPVYNTLTTKLPIAGNFRPCNQLLQPRYSERFVDCLEQSSQHGCGLLSHDSAMKNSSGGRLLSICNIVLYSEGSFVPEGPIL
jgi:hypothetical protein